MDLLQSLAGRATDAVGRLAASLNAKPGQRADASAGASIDFARAFAQAMSPEAEAAEGEQADAIASLLGEAGALDASAVGAAVDPTAVQRGLDTLDPAFRAKLERVIERMQAEFGHSVRITETFRSQERQNHLYEQGRSRPGPVVTWTKASNHTLGRAADVIIDGTYGNPLAYERLAQIAGEEGLRTLGPRDAGHIELPRGAAGSGLPRFAAAEPALVGADAAAGQAAWEPALEVASARNTGMARVAQVAQVAEVAEVARVATVATPGGVPFAAGSFGPGVQAHALQTDRGAAATHRTSEAVQALHQAIGNHQGIAALRSELGRGFSEGDSSSEGEQPFGWQPEIVNPDAGLSRAPFQAAVTEILAAGGTGAAERLARVLEIQDSAASGPVNSVLLRVDNPAGGEDRIRVDLRGAGVEATIDMRNVGEAERVANRLGELQRTLERHGLESETLRVRAATAQSTADVAEVTRVGIAVGESSDARGSRTGTGGNGSESFRETWKESSQQGQSRRDPSDPRNRERRYQPEKETA